MIPEYLVLICEFDYTPHGRTRYLPVEVRRFLMGGKGRLGLPGRINKKFGRKLLAPLYFSLIKHPVKIRGLLVNAALGAVVIYRVAVVDRDDFMQVCKAVNEEVQKRFGDVKEVKRFRLMASYAVDVELPALQAK